MHNPPTHALSQEFRRVLLHPAPIPSSTGQGLRVVLQKRKCHSSEESYQKRRGGYFVSLSRKRHSMDKLWRWVPNDTSTLCMDRLFV